MSTTETEPATETTETDEILSQERQRLWTVLADKQAHKVSDYKNTIKHTGGLLTASMSYAYSRGFSDAMKLLLNERKK